MVSGYTNEKFKFEKEVFMPTYDEVMQRQKASSMEVIENNFTHHKPFGNQPKRYDLIRQKAKELAQLIESVCPPSREKSLAFTKLEESVMWANASIARNEKEITTDGLQDKS